MELKLNYALNSELKSHHYEVTTYIFTPRILGLTRQSYPSHRFYSDAAAFIRMTSPIVRLSDLSKKKVVKPWAADIKNEIDQFSEGDGGDINLVEYNLKLLACVYKRALTDETKNLIERLEQPRPEDGDIVAALAAYLDDIETALQRLRKVGERSQRDGLPEQLQQAWLAIDEYSALITEHSLTQIIERAETNSSPPKRLTKVIERLKNLAIDQYHYRRSNGYASYAVDGERNEYLPHRWRVLKRFISTALYLDVERQQSGRVIRRLIAMASAGAAMLFATLALLFIQDHWATSLSTAFVTAMVVSYVIKDQIKDLGKTVVGRSLARISPDHVVFFLGSDGTKLGKCKEFFNIAEVTDLPRSIQDLRYIDLDSYEAIGGRPENVMCHTKQISLDSQSLRRQFKGATGLTDVLRLNMQSMLTRMDDEYENYRYVHPRTREILETKCSRIYRVNIILELKDPNHNVRTHRARVVLDKSGIVRIEDVTPKESRDYASFAEAS